HYMLLSLSLFFLYLSLALPHLHSFPTRRSSDLNMQKYSSYRRQFLCLLIYLVAIIYNIMTLNMVFVYLWIAIFLGHLMFLLCTRSEEHTSELQSRFDLVCRLLLEKKNKNKTMLM